MARSENPPVDRGSWLEDGIAIDTANPIDPHLEGKEWVFEDYSPTTGLSRSGRNVRCRLVRNNSGIALLPRRCVQFDTTTAGKYGSSVTGYANTTAQDCAVVDEYLPSAGAPNGALFWVVVEGPTEVLTDLAGGANNPFNLGSTVVALTAVTSGATTAGRVAPQDLTGSTANLGNQIQNALGYALTAKTTANTNAALLIVIAKPK